MEWKGRDRGYASAASADRECPTHRIWQRYQQTVISVSEARLLFLRS